MPPLNQHDPHSNKLLLFSIFVFATLLLYLTTHRPTSTSTLPPLSSSSHKNKVQIGSDTTQRPLVTPAGPGEIIQHRIVAIGDIHGDYPALTKILRKASLIDLKGQWIGGETILVQTGDIVDRGVDTIACYKFMQTLTSQAEKSGGTVVSLLGNHEIMNALGDWRYVNPNDIKSFGGERNRREAMSTGWIGKEWRQNYSITARVPYLTRTFPSVESIVKFPPPTTESSSSNQKFVSEPSPYFERDSSKLDLDGAISFVHGGIIPEYLETLSCREKPLTEINRIGKSLMDSLIQGSTHYPVSLPRSANQEQRLFWSEKGPMWNREWATLEEGEICERVVKVLEKLRVRRLVMGHTPSFEGIVSRCKGKVLLIDTGISRAYGGAHSFLDVSHTLTPYSRQEEEEEDFSFLNDKHSSYNEVLGIDDDDDDDHEGEGVSRWVEREIVKAVYESRENGLPGEETLVDYKRVIKIR